MSRSLLVLICFTQVFILGCETLRTREDIRRAVEPKSESVSSEPLYSRDDGAEYENAAPVEASTPVLPSLPKIGLILGGGGAKTFAHIGFLRELGKDKIPLHIIGGVEFAAPIAALYANKEQANEVEWQMFKLKDEDLYKKNMLGAKGVNGDISQLKDFLNTAFNKMKIDSFSVPYACPSYNFKKNQVYLMNRGSLPQVMSLCMAYPPIYRPTEGAVAGVRDITALANYMRSKGANYIVFVNVLEKPGKNFFANELNSENVLWGEIAGLYNKPLASVDAVVTIDTAKYGIMNFEKRRDIMNQGASSFQQFKNLVRRWGL